MPVTGTEQVPILENSGTSSRNLLCSLLFSSKLTTVARIYFTHFRSNSSNSLEWHVFGLGNTIFKYCQTEVYNLSVVVEIFIESTIAFPAVPVHGFSECGWQAKAASWDVGFPWITVKWLPSVFFSQPQYTLARKYAKGPGMWCKRECSKLYGNILELVNKVQS